MRILMEVEAGKIAFNLLIYAIDRAEISDSTNCMPEDKVKIIRNNLLCLKVFLECSVVQAVWTGRGTLTESLPPRGKFESSSNSERHSSG